MNVLAWLSIQNTSTIYIEPSDIDFITFDWEEFAEYSLKEMPPNIATKWAQKLRNLAHKLEQIT